MFTNFVWYSIKTINIAQFRSHHFAHLSRPAWIRMQSALVLTLVAHVAAVTYYIETKTSSMKYSGSDNFKPDLNLTGTQNTARLGRIANTTSGGPQLNHFLRKSCCFAKLYHMFELPIYEEF